MVAETAPPVVGERLDGNEFSTETDAAQDLGTVIPLTQYELPDHDTGVDHIEDEATASRYSSGTVWHEVWTMSDGTRYDVATGEPNRPKTDVPLVKTTAWGTQVKGLNLGLGIEFLNLGMPFVIVRPEINASLDQSHSAHNINTILDETERQGRHQSGLAIVEGISRGAMIGFGINAYAPRHDRKVIYSELIDPCLGRKLNPANPVELARHVANVPSSVICSMRQIGKIVVDRERAKRMRETVDFSVNGARQFYRTGRVLFSGEAGAMAGVMPEDTQMLVRFFNHSLANHADVYKRILARYQGALTDPAKGAHLSCIRDDSLERPLERIALVATQLGEKVAVEDLDFTAVHLPFAQLAA